MAARYVAADEVVVAAPAVGRDAGQLEAAHDRGLVEPVAAGDGVDAVVAAVQARAALRSRSAPSPTAGGGHAVGSCSRASSHRARRRGAAGRSSPAQAERSSASPSGSRTSAEASDCCAATSWSHSGESGQRRASPSAKAASNRRISCDRYVELSLGRWQEGGLEGRHRDARWRPPRCRGAAAGAPRARPGGRPRRAVRSEAASRRTSASVTSVPPIFTKARLRPRASKTWSTGLRLARAVPSPRLKSTGSPNTSPR